MIVTVIGRDNGFAVRVNGAEQISTVVVGVLGHLAFGIGPRDDLSQCIVCVACGIALGIGLRFQQAVFIAVYYRIFGADLFGCGHAVCIVGVSRYRAAEIGVLCYLIAVVVNKGFFGEGFFGRKCVNCRITDLRDITLGIIGEIGRVAVFVGYLRRLIKAVIGLDHLVAIGIGLFDNVVIDIVLVCLGVTVFVGVLDQKPLAVILAVALLSVTVGCNTFITLIMKQGLHGAGNCILLLDYMAEGIVGVYKATSALGITTGYDPM